MTTIKDIFQQHASEYIRRFKNAMPQNHLKVIQAILDCRSPQCGVLIYQCQQCAQPHQFFRSCGNRHCPACQNDKTRQWLDKQIDRQIPGHHFLITFTVPEELRRFIRSNQRVSYAAMFTASSHTLKTFAADDRWVGGDLPGFLGVLHTWGRQLHYHPHIHYVVPAGAVSKTDGTWHASQLAFFAPVKAMSIVYRAKLREEFKKAGLYDAIDPRIWEKGFIVNSRAVGSAYRSIKYLAPYVFKVAISNHRIIKMDDAKVFFRYKKSKSNRWRTMALSVMEFMRRFLQHVLPTGFMKIRYYGFLSPGSSVPANQVSALVELALGLDIEARPSVALDPAPLPCCRECGGILTLKGFRPPMPLLPGADYG